MTAKQSAWLVAAENGYLPGGKIGGVGDVIRDLPIALAALGWKIRIVTPAYGRFHQLPGAKRLRRFAVPFGGKRRFAEAWQLPSPAENVEMVVIAHALLDPRGDGRIYHEDDNGNPFATDAGKFAFFGAALAALLESDADAPHVLHLHDWHAGMYLALRAAAGETSVLKQVRCVFTIHNLAYQGIRPIDGHASSLRAWFPDRELPLARMTDPRYPDCVNFMVSAIRLADACNTVSPTYAREITRPSNPESGFIGGEGLEQDLQEAAKQQRLMGILNGCMYEGWKKSTASWDGLKSAIGQHAPLISANDPGRAWLQSATRPQHFLTSVGRLVEQKAALFLQPVAGHDTALEGLLQELGPDSLLVLLGSGDRELERRISAIAANHANLLFLKGYAEALSAVLYDSGDLFLMPSSFEPCGISQMLAMRSGQPCVVHGVGGLKDTVKDRETGFVFTGIGMADQASAFLIAVDSALELREQNPASWTRICENAAAQRFSWEQAAQSYIDQLYQGQAAL